MICIIIINTKEAKMKITIGREIKKLQKALETAKENLKKQGSKNEYDEDYEDYEAEIQELEESLKLHEKALKIIKQLREEHDDEEIEGLLQIITDGIE
jgi:hypothetical protein